MLDISKISIKTALIGLRNKEFSAVDLVSAYIKNCEANRNLNVFITETFEQALVAAKIADENIAKGEMRELEGVPIGIKDLYCTKNVRTTAGSKMLEDFVPTYESTVTQKLLDAGAISLGKLNMDEFAMGSANTNSYFGPVISPFKKIDSNEDLVPGGSSGGSSAGLAANLFMAATGSDTGGSIRQPASFTGTVGIKPTYGRCSRYGMIAFASSLDQAGIFAKNVEDAALLQKIISGYDDKDSTSIDIAVPDFDKLLNADVKGKKIGIPKEYRTDDMPAEIEKLWQEGIAKLRAKGAEIVDISLPHTKYASAIYYVIAPAECSSNLARFDGVRFGHQTAEKNIAIDQLYEKSRKEGFGNEVKRRILIGTHVLSSGFYDAYYKKALKMRRLVKQDFDEAFKKVDAILTPTTPNAAYEIDQSKNLTKSNPVKIYLSDIFTVPANLAGLPAMSVPAGLSEEGLPLGLQIIGKHFDEQTVFNIGLALENK